MKISGKGLWHLALLVLMLCGTQRAHATWADDEFGNNGNFNATVRDNNCLHFKLIYSADKGYNCWVNRNAYIRVDRYTRNQSYISSEEIFRYDGWESSSKVRVNLKRGAIHFTNNKDSESILEKLDNDWVGWTNKTGDKWVIELDWFPPQEWQKDGELLDVKIQVDYKDNDDGNKTKYVNRLDKFDLNGKVPTFSITSTGFLTDYQHAAKGEVWASAYRLSSACHELSSTEGISQNVETATSGTLYNKAEDRQRTVKYGMLFVRNENMKQSENRYWSLENTVSLPAYHRIHNFGYSKQSGTLRWELHDTDQGDRVASDAFLIETSTMPNFSDARELTHFSFEVGKDSEASHSHMEGTTQVFEYSLPEGHDGSYFRIRRQSAEKLGWNQDFAASSSSTNFIGELCVSVATNATDARNALLRQGYRLMDFNLNHGVKGNYVYLGYKETDNPLAAVSRIAIRRGAQWAADKGATYTDNGYRMMPVQTVGLGAGNLTEGIDGGTMMYLYYSKDQVKGKGRSLVTRMLHTSERNTLASGYRYVGESLAADASNPSDAVNLNQSTHTGVEEIRLVCQMHEHVSDFFCRKEGNDIYAGHECCGMLIENSSHLRINSTGDLALLREVVQGGFTDITAELMTDIVLNREVLVDGMLNPRQEAVNLFKVWEPIGNSQHHYSGTFDGNGHSISGIYINGSASPAGTFGILNGAKIRNLVVKDAYILTAGAVGGIAGQIARSANDSTIIDDCVFQGYLECGGDGGGLVAATFDPKVHLRNCYTQGRIRCNGSNMSAGGIIGYTSSKGASISFCLSEMACDYYHFTGLSYHASKLSVRNSYCTVKGNALNPQVGKEDLASGKVAFDLNSGNSGMHWGQQIDTDRAPFLLACNKEKATGNVTVYREMGLKCTNPGNIVPTGLYINHIQNEYATYHASRVHHAEKAPTCVDKGNLEYWICNDCKGVFGNEACTTQLVEVPVIEETGSHDYDVFDMCIYCKQSRMFIEEGEADGIRSASGHSHTTELYDLSGRRINRSRRGIIIQKDSQGNVRKVMR